MNDPKLHDTRRTGDWTGDEWVGDKTTRATTADPVTTPDPAATDDPAQTAARTEHWNKSSYVGDHGDGVPAAQDPDTMPEGETSISGNRHTPGEEHWAPGDDTRTPTDNR